MEYVQDYYHQQEACGKKIAAGGLAKGQAVRKPASQNNRVGWDLGGLLIQVPAQEGDPMSFWTNGCPTFSEKLPVMERP